MNLDTLDKFYLKIVNSRFISSDTFKPLRLLCTASSFRHLVVLGSFFGACFWRLSFVSFAAGALLNPQPRSHASGESSPSYSSI
ncbi:hypothetical protein RJT34_06480 [Clitoria ternatea]|uniref:Uncharacterized protein n=1 Tax=Clitoria ternatea TaxID=43366 RepID=A0AAN9K460_CLITE